MDAGPGCHLQNLNMKRKKRRCYYDGQRNLCKPLTGPSVQGCKKHFECHERSGHCLTALRTWKTRNWRWLSV